jgi:hypothetical protein
MAAPTTAARVKKTLANPEPSTHGPQPKYMEMLYVSAHWGRPEDAARTVPLDHERPVLQIAQATIRGQCRRGAQRR